MNFGKSRLVSSSTRSNVGLTLDFRRNVAYPEARVAERTRQYNHVVDLHTRELYIIRLPDPHGAPDCTRDPSLDRAPYVPPLYRLYTVLLFIYAGTSLPIPSLQLVLLLVSSLLPRP